MKLSVGLSIGEQYLKVVAVKSSGIRPKVAFCAVEPIQSFTDEQISNALVGILKKHRLKPQFLILCLSRNLVTVRNLHLPSQDKQEIIQMIDLNVCRIVPYKKEEIVFGYQILGLDEMNYTNVILAIVKNDVIRRQSKIIEKSGLFIERVSLSSHGAWGRVVESCRSELNQDDLYLLLDIDSAFTDFIIFSRGNLLFTRSINVGLSPAPEAYDMFVTRLLGEVKQSLIMFYNEETNKKPAAVFISGARLKDDFSKIVESELGIPAKAVASVDTAKDVSLTAVAELAARYSEQQIHFILPELNISKSLREKTRDLIILGTSVIYLFTVICAMLLGRIYNKQSYLKSLAASYAGVEKELGGLLGQLNKIEFVKGQLAQRKAPMFVFARLQKIIPDEIAVNSIVMDETGKLALRGQAVLLSDVFKFINTLEAEKSFKDVQTKYTRKKKIKDKDLTDFELSFTLSE